MPSIEAFQLRLELPKVQYLLYEYFFKPAILDDDQWRQRCQQPELDFGKVPTEAQVHTFLEDHYFAWLYECQCSTADIPLYEGRTLVTDYDTKFIDSTDNEMKSVCDVLLPDLEVEFDATKKDFVIVKQVRNDDGEPVSYVKLTVSTDARTQSEQESSKEDFLLMRERRVNKQREVAKKASEEKNRKDGLVNVAKKLEAAKEREKGYDERRKSAVGKKDTEALEKAIADDESTEKRKDMDRLKTLSGVVEDIIIDESTGERGEKRRKVIQGFTQLTAAFFKAKSLALKAEKNHKDKPRKKWENCYRLMLSLKGLEPPKSPPKREERETKIDAMEIIEL